MVKRGKMTSASWTEKKGDSLEGDVCEESKAVGAPEATKKTEKAKVKGQTVYLDLSKWKALGYLAIDLDRSQRDLLLEAVDLLLQKYKRG